MKIINYNFRKRFHLILLLFLLLGCGGAADDTLVLKLGHGLDTSHSVHEGMVFMADLIHEKSDGEMRVDIYPNEQLGTERETLELLQIGSLDMTKVSSSVMENFTPIYSIFGIPFLFENQEHMYAIQDGPIGKRILEASRPYRIIGLAYYDAGTRSFYTTNTPVRTPEDLNGLSIRVQESATAIRMVNTLGGSATPISWGELYTALQQGVVQGAENNAPSFYLSRHYEVAKYYSLNEHSAPPDMLLFSENTWENVLNEEQRAIIEEAALESVPHQRALWKKASETALQAVQEAGVEIIRPDRQPFMEASQPLYEHLKSQQPEIYDLMLEIQEVGNEYTD
ncbi:MAG: TRAP transporter substrate-binding protein [Balneolales bacterium]